MNIRLISFLLLLLPISLYAITLSPSTFTVSNLLNIDDGTVVYLDSGTYVIDEALIKAWEDGVRGTFNVTFTNANGTAIIDANSFAEQVEASFENCDNLTIENITLKNIKLGFWKCTNSTFNNITSKEQKFILPSGADAKEYGKMQSLLSIGHGDNCTIKNCDLEMTFSGFSCKVIKSYRGTNHKFLNNTIRGNLQSAYEIWSNESELTNDIAGYSGALVKGDYIERTVTGGNEDHGIYFHDVSDAMIDSVTIIGWSATASGGAVKIKNSNNVEVKNCIFYTSGILLRTGFEGWQHCSNIYIHDNEIHGEMAISTYMTPDAGYDNPEALVFEDNMIYDDEIKVQYDASLFNQYCSRAGKNGGVYNNGTKLGLNLTSGINNTGNYIISSLVSATGVSISPSNVALNVGDTTYINKTVSPANTTDQTVIWSSGNPSVAKVNSIGSVLALSEGTTFIKAITIDGAYKDSTEITVNAISVTNVSLNKNSAILDINQTLTLQDSIAPSNATNKSVYWFSSEPTVASVNVFGIVSALSEGTTSIYVKTQDGEFKDTCFITVNPPVSVSGVTVSPSIAEIYTGQTMKLMGAIAPDTATDKSVTWVSNDTTVAIVDESGLVSAVAEGVANIAVTTNDGGYSDTCKVIVTSLNGEAIYTETFEKMPFVGEWGNGASYVGDNDFEWTLWGKGYDLVKYSFDTTNYIYLGLFDKDQNIGISSGTIPGGISSFSVQCRDIWSVGVERNIQLLINGVIVGSMEHTGEEIYEFNVDSINKPGDITIAINNVSPYIEGDGENKFVAFDNITWITYSGPGNSIPEINAQTFSVKENCANETIVGIVQANDSDINQTLTFSIEGGNSDNIFIINKESGEIKVTDNTLLDYETTTSYSLTVKVTDSGVFPESSTATITVNIEDVDDGTGINDKLSKAINIYPNPFTSLLIIQLGQKDYNQAKLLDLTGREILSIDINQKGELQLSPSYSVAPAGIYIVQLISFEETRFIKVLRK